MLAIQAFFEALKEGALYGLAPLIIVCAVSFGAGRLLLNHGLHAAVMAAAAAIGCFLGIFVGGSRQPVVSVFLPAGITLVSTLIAYYFSKDQTVYNRQLIPGAIVSLVTAAAFGSYFASELRATSEQFTYYRDAEQAKLTSQMRMAEKFHDEVTVVLNRYAYCAKQFTEDICLKLLAPSK